MVTLHNPQATVGKNGEILPVMPVHILTVKRDTRSFQTGQSARCYITIMSDGRYAVFDASFTFPQKWYEVFTEDELHITFDEQQSERIPV
jgi:hypothetical protein